MRFGEPPRRVRKYVRPGDFGVWRGTALSENLTDNKKPTFTAEEVLDFHRFPTPGKIAVVATKPMATQRDLSLAYSPGVAVPVRAIAENPDLAYDYTSKGNLVAVISNG